MRHHIVCARPCDRGDNGKLVVDTGHVAKTNSVARAYLRDAQFLVLDEPTAALDAHAEYEVFQRFAELTAGKTTLLISHRFSTVRMADRIVVLAEGRVSEEGTHRHLIASGGDYAEMFELQAANYR